jgi:hypothetical protein
LKSLKGRDHSEDLGIDGRIIKDTRKIVWNGFIWLRIGTGDVPLVNMVMNLRIP